MLNCPTLTLQYSFRRAMMNRRCRFNIDEGSSRESGVSRASHRALRAFILARPPFDPFKTCVDCRELLQ